MKRARIAAVALNVVTAPIAQTDLETGRPGWNRNSGPCDANGTSVRAQAAITQIARLLKLGLFNT
jgi:hypothetical protein